MLHAAVPQTLEYFAGLQKNIDVCFDHYNQIYSQLFDCGYTQVELVGENKLEGVVASKEKKEFYCVKVQYTLYYQHHNII